VNKEFGSSEGVSRFRGEEGGPRGSLARQAFPETKGGKKNNLPKGKKREEPHGSQDSSDVVKTKVYQNGAPTLREQRDQKKAR